MTITTLTSKKNCNHCKYSAQGCRQYLLKSKRIGQMTYCSKREGPSLLLALWQTRRFEDD